MPRSKITIVGTSHISPDSVKKAREVILREKPQCVAIELDPQRYEFLKSNVKVRASIRNPMYFVLNNMQTWLGEKTGVIPGSEMLAAIDAGKDVKSKIVLIDMDIAEIMGKFGEIGSWEKFKLVFKLLLSFIPWPGTKQIDVSKVPDEKLVKEALRQLKREMPQIHKILITERNKYMAAWIKQLSKKYKKVVVVVGIGHKEGLKKLLKGRR